MTLRGLVNPDDMPKLRRMVVELHDNLGKVILPPDRLAVQRYVRTARRFTTAEERQILDIYNNFKNPRSNQSFRKAKRKG